MIGGRRPIKGRKLADRRVRVERPHSAYFRYTGPGTAGRPRPAASGTAVGPSARCRCQVVAASVDRSPSEEEIGERLSKRLALPIFSSDAISSSAYATEEILRGPGRWRAPARCSCRSRSRSRSPSCSRSSRSRTARSAAPSRPAAARTPWPAQELAPILGLVAAGRAADRLRHDGRRVHVVGDGPADLDRPGARPAYRIEIARRRSIALITVGEPARPARVGQHLRGPDLPVRRPGPADRRRRPVPHRAGHGRAVPAPARGRAPGHRGARACSSSCARSPAAPWR